MVVKMRQSENRERAAARLAAVQALYQMETAGIGVESVILEFNAHRLGGDIEGVPIHGADAEFFAEVARGVIENQRRIDPFIDRNLAKNWALARLDATARAILRAAVYELIKRPDVPVPVVINEYVEIAKAFFEGDEPSFINGVLDAAARTARPDEDRDHA